MYELHLGTQSGNHQLYGNHYFPVSLACFTNPNKSICIPVLK